MTTHLTSSRNSFVWVLIRDDASHDRLFDVNVPSDEVPFDELPAVADLTTLPIPSVGHLIYHEPTDETFYIMRILWEVREGYPLAVKVFGKVVQGLGNGYCDFPAPTPKGEPP